MIVSPPLGLSPEAIFAALNSQNVLTAAGAIETRGGQIFIRLDGAFDRLQQIPRHADYCRGQNAETGRCRHG